MVTLTPVEQWLGYSFHYTRNIENMKKKVEELEARKEKNAIDASGGNCEEIKQYVKSWLAEVNEIMGKAKDLVIEDDKRAKTTGSYRTLLNLKLRHQQSKKAKKIVEDIDEVLKNSRFESRMLTMKVLIVALKDDNINLVGVWGMAGVGKTTLVREVAKQVKEEKLFDEVVIATVTQSPDFIRIQGEIADKLDLKIDKKTLSGRADLRRARLSKEKNQKILVILDDIWKKLDLDEIGIPSNGCKLVVTSRNSDRLSCEMGTQKDFGLNLLPQEEARSLFEKMMGDSLKDQKLQSIATEVSKECAGLPLALVNSCKVLKN
ncbi:putative disease resistance protein At5g05400 [Castanea sativa]|uniref:putative disease resistance protein At5g05400 n=1 Tax=Castanea sativa TaxID=21020 RepID=UPI003F64F5E0